MIQWIKKVTPEAIKGDIRYVASNWVWLIGVQILLVLTGFAFTIVATRLLPQAVFGRYQFFLALLGTMAIVAMPGLDSSLMRSVSKGKERTFASILKAKLLFSLIGSAILVIATIYLRYRNNDLWLISIISTVLFPIIYSFVLTQSFYAGRKDFKSAAILQVFTEAVPMLTAMAVIFFTTNITIILLAYLVTKAIATTIGLTKALSTMNKRDDKKAVRYGIQLSIATLPWYKNFLDDIIVTYFLGFVATAIYSIAIAIPEQMVGLGKQFGLLVFVKATGERKLVLAAYRKRFLYMVAMFAGLAAAVIVVLPFIVRIFFGNSYEKAIFIGQLFAAAYIIRIVASVNLKVLEAQGEAKRLQKLNIIAAVAEIVFMVVLTPLLGLFGILVAKTISNGYLLVWSLPEIYRFTA